MKGNRIITLCVTALLAALLVATACAQEEIDRKLKADKDGTVVIKNISGWVSVIGWNKNEVRVTGFLGRGTEKLEFERDGDRIMIVVKLPRRAKNVDGSELEIHLPRGSRVDVSTVSAEIEVEEVEGELFLESVSGDVTAKGEMKEIEVSTVSGEIILTVKSGEVSAKSVSGDIELTKVFGEVTVESVSGDILIEGGEFDRLRSEAVSGEVEFHGGFTKDGSYRFESHSGDITLYLSGKVDADFDVSTFSGEIDNDFGKRAERTSKYTPGKELRFSTGSGDARVRVETFSGDIELIKR